MRSKFACMNLPNLHVQVKPHGTWSDGRKLRKSFAVYFGGQLWGCYCYEKQATDVADRLKAEVCS